MYMIVRVVVQGLTVSVAKNMVPPVSGSDMEMSPVDLACWLLATVAIPHVVIPKK